MGTQIKILSPSQGGRPHLVADRRRMITELVTARGSMRVGELSSILEVSEEMCIRDRLFSVAPIVVALDLAGCAPRRMSMPLLSWAGLRSHVKPILEHKGNRGVLKRLEFF